MGWQNNLFQLLLIQSGQPGTGLFVYDGVPAAGNLIGSIAAENGFDSYGNAYQPGICVYGGTGQPVIQAFVSGSLPTAVPRLSFKSNVASEQTAGQVAMDIGNPGAGNEYLAFNFDGPSVMQQADYVQFFLHSSAEDKSFPASGNLEYRDQSGAQHKFAYWDNTGFWVMAGKTAGIEPGTGTSPANPGSGAIWHRFTFFNGWGPYTAHFPRYRQGPAGDIQWSDCMFAVGTAANGTQVATINSNFAVGGGGIREIPAACDVLATQAPHLHLVNDTLYCYGVGTSTWLAIDGTTITDGSTAADPT